jgi:hypothetical protein
MSYIWAANHFASTYDQLKLSPNIGFILNFLIIVFGCFLTIVSRILFGLKLIPYEVSELYSIWEMKRSFVRYSITTYHNLKIVWFLGNSWIIYALCTGGKGSQQNCWHSHEFMHNLNYFSVNFFRSGFLYRLLSSKILRPLTRL